jgi:hypothetical protein
VIADIAVIAEIGRKNLTADHADGRGSEPLMATDQGEMKGNVLRNGPAPEARNELAQAG